MIKGNIGRLLLTHPQPGPQPRHVPWMGSKPVPIVFLVEKMKGFLMIAILSCILMCSLGLERGPGDTHLGAVLCLPLSSPLSVMEPQQAALEGSFSSIFL